MQENAQVGQVRLQKFLARAGVASRRACERIIEAGRVSGNGNVVTELGTKVDPSVDEVSLDGAPVCKPNQAVTLMLNKPAGFLTSMKDPQGRPCVAELVPCDEIPGLYPLLGLRHYRVVVVFHRWGVGQCRSASLSPR